MLTFGIISNSDLPMQKVMELIDMVCETKQVEAKVITYKSAIELLNQRDPNMNVVITGESKDPFSGEKIVPVLGGFFPGAFIIHFHKKHVNELNDQLKKSAHVLIDVNNSNDLIICRKLHEIIHQLKRETFKLSV